MSELRRCLTFSYDFLKKSTTSRDSNYVVICLLDKVLELDLS